MNAVDYWWEGWVLFYIAGVIPYLWHKADPIDLMFPQCALHEAPTPTNLHYLRFSHLFVHQVLSLNHLVVLVQRFHRELFVRLAL